MPLVLSRLLPRLELSWLAGTEFFPPYRSVAEWRGERHLCLGTRSRAIGDALVLTSLPRRLKALYPDLRIKTFSRAFNPYVFENNPHCEGVQWAPRSVYGDDADWGEGHLIRQKEAFFGLRPEAGVGSEPRPEIHLSAAERAWAARQDERLRVGNPGPPGRPVCVIHPWGRTISAATTSDYWETVVRDGSDRFRFWQVGVPGQVAIRGCEAHWLLPQQRSACRRLFALLERASAFIGVDSGPMHVAAAFRVPSLVLTPVVDVPKRLALRDSTPYFLHRNREVCFLYGFNRHLEPSRMGRPEMERLTGEFLDGLAQNSGQKR